MRRFLIRSRFEAINERSIRKACVAAALATAWNTPALFAAPIQLGGTVTPEQSLSHAYLYVNFYQGNGSGATYYDALFELGDVPGGVTTDIHETFPDELPGEPPPAGDWNSSYAIIGLYDAQADGVSISLDRVYGDFLISNGSDWPFADLNDESVIADLLVGGFTEHIRNFLGYITIYREGSLSVISQTAPVVSFSNATANGETYVTIVPEPQTLLLVAVGGLAFLRRRG